MKEEQDAWIGLPWEALVVYFSEIALKGGNRRPFAEMLRQNIKARLAGRNAHVSLHHDRLLVRMEPEGLEEAARALALMAGVAHVAPVRILPKDLAPLREAALATYRACNRPGASFGVRVRRSDKHFPMKSSELAGEIGGYVKENTGAPVDLEHPDIELSFKVNDDGVYQNGPVLQGPNGLPAGVSGNVLALFSGGIDSPVAAWRCFIRGCRVQFLHIHTFPRPEQAADSKIAELIRLLVRPQAQAAELHLIPYHAFESGLMSAAAPREYELILFRRFMARAACRVARSCDCEAIMTGDNLGQVASQTIGNLAAFDDVCDLPVLRPLVAANKDDIVRLARRLGTFDASVERYKDCCSLVAHGAQTRPRLSTIHRIESELPIETMMNDAMQELVRVTIE